jgi:teichuronic acid biosynthesis glycosyltransferase TuaG
MYDFFCNMQEINPILVSVVIPAYNAAPYIKETLDSILQQTYSIFEIIIVDDGSTDETALEIKQIQDERIQYFYKINEGVSKARNYGFERIKGKYVIFFDADDVMEADFIDVRLQCMEENPSIGFCCGEVINFPIQNEQPIFGIAEKVFEKLLLNQTETQISTCPSNYMFRKQTIEDANVRYNEHLSSTADRYYMLDISRFTQGKLVKSGKLKYRISPNSMSAVLTPKFVDDNEKFVQEILNNNILSSVRDKQGLFNQYYMLTGANWKIKRIYKVIYYCFLIIIKTSRHLLKYILRKQVI